MVLVGIQLSVIGSYMPPVSAYPEESRPPQTIISVPVQTAVWLDLAEGALVVLVAIQLSVSGLYLPPVLKNIGPGAAIPPQTIISLSVQTAV
jgi:hypothetical protein